MQPAHPAQAADDVGDVAPEHAPVDVRVIDDDVAQVPECAGPAEVLGEDADVQHVRVGQDDLRLLPQL